MKLPCVIASLLGVSLASAVMPADAQTSANPEQAPLTREQVKMERDDFLKSHRWDDRYSSWVLKSGVEPPHGVKSRAEIEAERDAFLSQHRWDNASSTWKRIDGEPRQMSTLTREQRRADTRNFLSTHRWDEQSQTWLEKSPKASR